MTHKAHDHARRMGEAFHRIADYQIEAAAAQLEQQATAPATDKGAR